MVALSAGASDNGGVEFNVLCGAAMAVLLEVMNRPSKRPSQYPVCGDSRECRAEAIYEQSCGRMQPLMPLSSKVRSNSNLPISQGPRKDQVPCSPRQESRR